MTEPFDPERDLKGVGIENHGLVCKNSIHDGVKTWCEHLQRTVQAGADHVLLHADQHIEVPIFPTADVYAEVWIGEDIGNGSAIMSLNFTPDIGRPYSVRLGFWNPGEGMGSIRLVILDYLKSRLDPNETFEVGPIRTRCPSRVHGMQETKALKKAENDTRWKWECLWNMVMEKACTPCIVTSAGDGDNNFGIDPDLAVNKPRWSS